MPSMPVIGVDAHEGAVLRRLLVRRPAHLERLDAGDLHGAAPSLSPQSTPAPARRQAAAAMAMLNARSRAGECSSRPAPLPSSAHTSRHGMPTAGTPRRCARAAASERLVRRQVFAGGARGDEPRLRIDPLECRRTEEAEHAAAAAFAGWRRDGDLPREHDEPRGADPAEQRQQQRPAHQRGAQAGTHQGQHHGEARRDAEHVRHGRADAVIGGRCSHHHVVRTGRDVHRDREARSARDSALFMPIGQHS